MSVPVIENPAPDLIAEFGRQAYYHIIHTLYSGLPEPPTNDPEALLRRNQAAISRIAALCPANTAEADIASLYVAASEQWKECLRLIKLPETPLKQAIQCRNQANAMCADGGSAGVMCGLAEWGTLGEPNPLGGLRGGQAAQEWGARVPRRWITSWLWPHPHR